MMTLDMHPPTPDLRLHDGQRIDVWFVLEEEAGIGACGGLSD